MIWAFLTAVTNFFNYELISWFIGNLNPNGRQINWEFSGHVDLEFSKKAIFYFGMLVTPYEFPIAITYV